MRTSGIIITVAMLALSSIAQAGITAFSIEQSDTTSGATDIDLSAQGSLDWGIFGTQGNASGLDLATMPTERKSGGSGFSSYTAINGAVPDVDGSYSPAYSEFVYRWTDGTIDTSANSLTASPEALGYFIRVNTHEGSSTNRGVGIEGSGTRLTISVSKAGTYQLKYYASTYNVGLDGSATLASEGTVSAQLCPVADGDAAGSGLDDYIFTVDFTTTEADSLTLDVVNSSTAAGAYAPEAFTLSGTASGEPDELNLGNIWPLGDSITDGVDDYGSRLPGGYREPLYTNLIARGYDLQFVGTTDINASTLLTGAGQEMHDGHSGWTIADIGTQVGLYEQVSSWHASIATPDIILLMIGINDLNHNSEIATAPARLELLISRLFTLNPNVRILIATLPDAAQDNPYRSDATNDIAEAVADYNTAMHSMVSNRRSQGQSIELVDMHAGLTLEDLDDGLHPNAAGHVKMSKIWANAIIPNSPDFTSNAVEVADGMVSLTANGALGTSYSLWTKEDLTTTNSWTLKTYDCITTNPFTIQDTPDRLQTFYRFSAP